MDKEYEEYDRDLLIRQAKLLYSDVEDWIIEMAVSAHIKTGGQKIEIDEEAVQQEKAKMFKGLEYSGY